MPAAWPAFAEKSSVEPFQWGFADCMLDLADWLQAASGLDLGAKWRGRYADADECRALFRRDGGITRVIRADAIAAGLVETATPQPGDIAMVKAFGTIVGGRRQAVFPMGGIMVPSGRWRVRAIVGHITHAFPVIVAWELPCRH